MSMIIIPDHVTVNYTSLKEEVEQHSDHAIRSKIVSLAFETLGCFAYHYSEEQSRQASEIIGHSVPSGDHIVFIEDFLVDLSEQEREAILAHELGHLVHGHLKNRAETGVLNSLALELEADSYAIGKGVAGKQLVSAITKLIHTSDRLIQKVPKARSKIRPGEFAEKVLANPTLQERMAVLLSQ